MCVCVSIERGGVKSEKPQLQFMSGAPSPTGKENKRREIEQVILEQADPTRTKRFAKTSIAKRDSVWSFELV